MITSSASNWLCQGLDMVVDACDIPLRIVIAPANRHHSPLLSDTLDTMQQFGELPEIATSVHLDRTYDSVTTREKLATFGLRAEISQKGKPAPVRSTKRGGWSNAPALGKTPTRSEGAGHRLLGDLLGGDHHRKAANTKGLDSLSLGEPTFTQTITCWRKL